MTCQGTLFLKSNSLRNLCWRPITGSFNYRNAESNHGLFNEWFYKGKLRAAENTKNHEFPNESAILEWVDSGPDLAISGTKWKLRVYSTLIQRKLIRLRASVTFNLIKSLESQNLRKKSWNELV